MDWTGLVYRHTFYPTARRPSVSASHTDRNEVWKEAIAHKEGEARNIQMTKSLLRASCLTLEIKKFRCYGAKKVPDHLVICTDLAILCVHLTRFVLKTCKSTYNR